ncbi:MAG: AI-2E family transporter [Sumerlaeia bacterium]
MTDPEQKQAPFLKFDPEMRRLVLGLGYLLFAAGIVFSAIAIWPFISTLFSVLSPFIVALVLAYILNPIVNFMQQRLKLKRIGGVVVVNLLILLVVAGFIAIVIPILSSQVKAAYVGIRDTTEVRIIPWISEAVLDYPVEENSEIVSDFQSYYKSHVEKLSSPLEREELEKFVEEWQFVSPKKTNKKEEFATHLTTWFDSETSSTLALQSLEEYLRVIEENSGKRYPLTWDDIVAKADEFMAPQDTSSGEMVERALGSTQLRTAAKSAAEGGAGFFARAAGAIVSAIGTLISSVVFLTFVLILSFYLLIDFSSMTGVIEVLCPDEHEDRLFDILKKIDVAVGGFIRGQIISSALVGLLAFIGLYAMGLQQYALLIGFIAFVGNVIPYLGPILGATPAVLYMLFTSDFDTFQERGIYLLLTVGLFGLIQTIDGFIFQPKIVGQSAQLHPISVIMALVIGGQFGFVGMILAVPMMCIVRILWKEFFWDERADEWKKTTGKKNLSDNATKRKSKAKKQQSKA